MQIRFADTKDIEVMVGLLNQLFSIEIDFTPDFDKQRSGLALLVDSPSAAIFVAEADGEVVGMVTAQLVISTAEGGLSGLIEDMVVDQNHRGQNIGTQLLDYCVTWCKEQGASRVQLLADQTNLPALAFYEKKRWNRTNMICLRQK